MERHQQKRHVSALNTDVAWGDNSTNSSIGDRTRWQQALTETLWVRDSRVMSDESQKPDALHLSIVQAMEGGNGKMLVLIAMEMMVSRQSVLKVSAYYA